MGAWVAGGFGSDPGKITPSPGVTSHLLSCLEVHVELLMVRRTSFVQASPRNAETYTKKTPDYILNILIFDAIYINVKITSIVKINVK